MNAEPGEARQLDVVVGHLKATFDSLATFDDVGRWDSEATEASSKLFVRAETLRAKAASLVSAARAEEQRIATLPWWQRLFASRRAHLALLAEAASIGPDADRAHADAEALLELIDFSPDNKKDQQALLKELRLEKKELSLRRKQSAVAQAEIRRAARIESADAGRLVFGLFYDASIAARDRRAIRREKEAQLRPHEDEKAALDRQLLALDRRIHWVQRFESAAD